MSLCSGISLINPGHCLLIPSPLWIDKLKGNSRYSLKKKNLKLLSANYLHTMPGVGLLNIYLKKGSEFLIDLIWICCMSFLVFISLFLINNDISTPGLSFCQIKQTLLNHILKISYYAYSYKTIFST